MELLIIFLIINELAHLNSRNKFFFQVFEMKDLDLKLKKELTLGEMERVKALITKVSGIEPQKEAEQNNWFWQLPNGKKLKLIQYAWGSVYVLISL